MPAEDVEGIAIHRDIWEDCLSLIDGLIETTKQFLKLTDIETISTWTQAAWMIRPGPDRTFQPFNVIESLTS